MYVNQINNLTEIEFLVFIAIYIVQYPQRCYIANNSIPWEANFAKYLDA